VAVIGVILVVVLAGVEAKTNGNSTAQDPLVGRTGKQAPDFALPALENTISTVSLASFRGKPLVINFWASWCVPCRTEMPLLEKAFRAEHRNVQFLGIDSNDSSSSARLFLKQIGVTYPAVSDSNGSVAIRYGLFGLPTTVFISASGAIVGRSIGQLHPSTLPIALWEAFHD
jgi:cytochrome c biogenesis protein CcmG, thiol:disulfide interchange protein DsbE